MTLERAWNSSRTEQEGQHGSVPCPQAPDIHPFLQWASFPQPLCTFCFGLPLNKCCTPVLIQTLATHSLQRKAHLPLLRVMTKLGLPTCPALQGTSHNCMPFMNSINIHLLKCLLLSFRPLKENVLIILFTALFPLTRTYMSVKKKKRGGGVKKEERILVLILSSSSVSKCVSRIAQVANPRFPVYQRF